MIRVAAELFAEKSEELLARVEQGEEVWIEKGGRVVARLVSPGLSTPGPSPADFDPSPLPRYAEPGYPAPEQDPVGTLLRLRERADLDGLSWKALRDEGRR